MLDPKYFDLIYSNLNKVSIKQVYLNNIQAGILILTIVQVIQTYVNF